MKTLLPAGLQVRSVGILLAGLAVEAWAHPGHHLLQIMPTPGVTVASAPPVNADARLSIAVIDAKTGRPTPVRVLITDANGRPLGAPGLPSIVPTPAAIASRLAEPGAVIGLPKEAIAVMHGRDDSAEAYGFQANGAFFISGSFVDMPIPSGTYRITLAKGYEYLELNDELVIKRGENVRRRYELRRWIDMPARGWYSSDDHIHLRRSPRENPLILDWIAAEDVHVGVLLQMGDFWTSYYQQYAFGPRGVYGRGNHLLISGQEEPRTHELGHTISFGATQYVRMQSEYYSFDRVFDRIHQLGGVSGYAHAGVMMFQGYRGLALDTLGGKIDFLEVMQFCAQKGPLALEHYYRFLDLGCKLTATGGSDFPWCGRGMRPGEEQFGPRIGDGRFYTYLGGELSFDRWLAGVKAGHTFVSSGPMIELLVNGRLPGSAIDLRPGEKIRVTARAWGHAARIPLQRLQIVGHSQVLREVTPSGAGQGPAELALDFELTPEHGIWIAARVDAGPTQFAHTTPVYVTVNGDGFHTRTNLDAQIALTRQHLEEIRGLLRSKGGPEEIDRRRTPLPWRYGDGSTRLEQRIADTLQKLDTLRRRN